MTFGVWPVRRRTGRQASDTRMNHWSTGHVSQSDALLPSKWRQGGWEEASVMVVGAAHVFLSWPPQRARDDTTRRAPNPRNARPMRRFTTPHARTASCMLSRSDSDAK